MRVFIALVHFTHHHPKIWLPALGLALPVSQLLLQLSSIYMLTTSEFLSPLQLFLMSSRQTRTFICSFSGPLLKLIKTELTSSFPASLLGHKMRGGSGLLLTPPISTFTLNQPAIQRCSLQFSNLSPLHLHFLYLIHAHTQLSYLQSCPNSANR